LPDDLLALGITAAELSPGRFRDAIPLELTS